MSIERCGIFAQIEEIGLNGLHGDDNVSRLFCALVTSIVTWPNSNCTLTVCCFFFYVNNTSGKETKSRNEER